MKKVFALFTVAGLAWMPVAAFAQDAAIEDGSAVVEDGGAVVEDGGTIAADAAVAEDATVVTTDAATPPEDAGTVAEDASAGVDSGSAGCGNVTFIGECAGDVLSWCAGTELRVHDCKTDTQFGASDRTCGLIDCEDESTGCQGYWCVAELNGDCSDTSCNASDALVCNVQGTCEQGTACDPDTFPTTCAGDIATFCNNASLEASGDCSQGGAEPYTCAVPPDSSTSVCVGLEGGDCGTEDGVNFACASGLTCTGGICGSSSTGTDAGGGSDASSNGTDAATSGDDDDSKDGCGCAATRAGSGAALVLAGLLGLALVRRRR